MAKRHLLWPIEDHSSLQLQDNMRVVCCNWCFEGLIDESITTLPEPPLDVELCPEFSAPIADEVLKEENRSYNNDLWPYFGCIVVLVLFFNHIGKTRNNSDMKTEKCCRKHKR